MRVLWFTNTPSLYRENQNIYNGGGWIESLEHIIGAQENIELAVSFFHPDSCFKVIRKDTTYYPISLYNTYCKKFKHILFYKKYDLKEVETFLKIIEDFKPDVIHIFGSEQSFGLITQRTKIPVIIHLQGILNPYKNAYYPPGICKWDFIMSNIFKPKKNLLTLLKMHHFLHNTERETLILRNCSYFMGRTNWDKDVALLFAPNSKYFYCSEVLREAFYKSNPWQLKKRDMAILISTLSKTSYKGFDLIMKTAKLLKVLAPNFYFEWKVFGVKEFNMWEKILGFKCSDINIHLKGIVDSETLVKNIQDADLFVHPSYIDNSPNSICEAQILGIPVLATNVGGISSLIENNITGILVPANAPYTLASKIIMLKNNSKFAKEIGSQARETALLRHNQTTIKTDLLDIYSRIQNATINN